MLITPVLLKEQIQIQIKNKLNKAASTYFELKNQFELESWNAIKYLQHDTTYYVTSVVNNRDSILVNVSNNSVEFQVDFILLSIEDIYKLYTELSNILSTTPPANIDLIDEV